MFLKRQWLYASSNELFQSIMGLGTSNGFLFRLQAIIGTHDDFMAELGKETSVYWKWIWESLIQNTQISSFC